MSILIKNRDARRVVLHLQGLTRAPAVSQDGDALYELIHQLGFVQVDTIQWVERAHHMILFSRNQNYRPADLHHLIEQEQSLFENYTHDASVIPSEFFPFWKHKFERGRDRLRKEMVKWVGPGFLDHCELLVEMIDNDGAIRSRDLERPKSSGPKDMWGWHDGKAALEFLWRTGTLSIAARDAFQKVYDLTPRVIPEPHFEATCSHEAFVDWACRAAIERLGFGSPANIAGYWKMVTIAECREWLKTQDETSIKEVTVESSDGSPPRKLFARGDIEEVIANAAKAPLRVRALSPFDPVIRDRTRLSWLFKFDYRIEIYVPAAKRKYGYYVFPLLEGERLIGRVDMRAHRSDDCLRVRRLWPEDGIEWSEARQKRLRQELKRQAKLAGVSNVECPPSAFG